MKGLATYKVKYWPAGQWGKDKVEVFPQITGAKDFIQRKLRTHNIHYILTQEIEMDSRGFEDA